MAAVAYESAVLDSNVERVWGLLRRMDFVWNPRVQSARYRDDFSIATEPWAVGAVDNINYFDGTTQNARLTELSDAHHRVTWEIVSSTPAVTYSSAQHTITCRRVTDSAVKGGATFVEWETHFSRDADANVIADAGFKAKEALQALAAEARKAVSFHTTAEEAAAGYDLKGKTYLVTGGNSGIGFETVRVLALRGAHVVFTARDDAKIAATLTELKPLLATATAGKVEGLVCALDSIKSVRAAAAAYRAKGYPLHGLILNAGVMACPYALTENKLETQFGTNHVGHFALTTGLLDVLKASAPARVVAVSSMGHRFGGIRLDDPNFTARPAEYNPFAAYGQSKTANILFAKQLNALLAKQGVKGVVANALHPGGIVTNLARHLGDAFTTTAAQAAAKAHAAAGKDAKDLKVAAPAAPAGPTHAPEVIAQTKQLFASYKFRLKTVPQGAATTVVAALHPEYAFGGKYGGGHYLSDCNVVPVSAPYAEDMALAEKLWALTEKIVADIKPSA